MSDDGTGTLYRVRYTFAGASGCCGTFATLAEAERAGQRCYDHFLSVAEVWIEAVQTDGSTPQ